jgi:hypothetical protein
MSEKLAVRHESKSEIKVSSHETGSEALKNAENAANEARSRAESGPKLDELESAAKEHAALASEKLKNDEGAAQAARNTHDVHPFVRHAPEIVLKHARAQFPKSVQKFSKIVHMPAVEKASEVVGKTVARPSGIMGGAVTALIGVTALNIFARSGGFRLPGGAFIVFLVLGWTLGLILEKLYRKTRKA